MHVIILLNTSVEDQEITQDGCRINCVVCTVYTHVLCIGLRGDRELWMETTHSQELI